MSVASPVRVVDPMHAHRSPTAPLTSFVGRDADSERLAAALRRARLVTVTGTGGVGKTRLVLETLRDVREQYADGSVFVSLGDVGAPDEVAPAVRFQLGLAPAATADLTQRLGEFLADKHLLLVLDNCEHVLDAGVRPLVAGLLAVAPGLHVLATSRERLAIAGEHVVGLHPFPVPTDTDLGVDEARELACVRLLEDRAAAGTQGFTLDHTTVAAALQMCAHLDGLPLAVELAAARLRSLSVVELAERMDDRFAMLTRGDPTARAVHHTLEAMVEWSWELCSPAERRLWSALSVFSGGADLEAIRAVCVPATDPVGQVIDDVDALVGKSVVTADTEGTRTRYRMLETLRAFGGMRRHEVDSSDAVVARHAGHYAQLALRSRAAFYTPGQLAWTLRLGPERANLLAAFDHLLTHGDDDGTAAQDLASALGLFWLVESCRDGRRMRARVLRRRPQPDVRRVVGLHTQVGIALAQGDLAAADEGAREGERLAVALGSARWSARARLVRVTVALFGGGSAADDDSIGVALEGTTDAADLEYRMMGLAASALGPLIRGDVERSRRQADRLIAECEALGERWTRAHGLAYRALTALATGDLETADRSARDGLETFASFRDVLNTAMMLDVLAMVAGENGDASGASELLGSAAALNRSVGSPRRTNCPPVDAGLVELEAALRSRLGTVEFERARDVGAGLTMEDVLARVRGPRPSAWGSRARGPGSDERGPLSAREYEVAVLVSTGLTNRAIAEQLALSPRTVDGHVERILAKLGRPSRAGVAAWVVGQRRPSA